MKYKKGDILISLVPNKNGYEAYIEVVEIVKVFKKPIKGDQYATRVLCGNFDSRTNDYYLNKQGFFKVEIGTFPPIGSDIDYMIIDDLGEVLKKHFFKPCQRKLNK